MRPRELARTVRGDCNAQRTGERDAGGSDDGSRTTAAGGLANGIGVRTAALVAAITFVAVLAVDLGADVTISKGTASA
jgi:hypothetical protein